MHPFGPHQQRALQARGASAPPRPLAYAAAGGESPLAKLLIGGAVTIALEMGGGHFLEFLKIACVGCCAGPALCPLFAPLLR